MEIYVYYMAGVYQGRATLGAAYTILVKEKPYTN
jgi:hypothetical protein